MRKKMTMMSVLGVLILAFSAVPALADNVLCSGGPCNGTIRSDVITGSQIRDKINARAGNDTVTARGGSDEVVGDAGNDTLRGDNTTGSSLDADDTVFGQLGDDTLVGRGGDDLLDGGFGFDRIDARELSTNAGVDTVLGGVAGDTIHAEDGHGDDIDCGSGVDEVFFDEDVDFVASNCETRHPL